MNLSLCSTCTCSQSDDNGVDDDSADSFATKLLDLLWWNRPLTAEQMVRGWRRELRGRRRQLVRGEWEISKRLAQVNSELAAAIKKKDQRSIEAVRVSLVQHQREFNKLIVAKTRIDSLDSQLRQQAALVRVRKSFAVSAEVFGLLNDMSGVGELREMAASMSAEMLKAGLVDDLVSTALSDTDDKVSNEADAYLNALTAEQVGEQLKRAPVFDADLEAEYEALNVTGLQNRLNALKMERAE